MDDCGDCFWAGDEPRCLLHRKAETACDDYKDIEDEDEDAYTDGHMVDGWHKEGY